MTRRWGSPSERRINTSTGNNLSDRLPGLKRQVAVVTGGSRGIGRGIAQGLAAAGAAVAVVARSHGQTEEVAAEISAAGGCAIGIGADVSDLADVERMTSDVERRLGPIDLLVNNAAVAAPLGPIAHVDPLEWWRCQEINVRGPLLCARAVLPAMCCRRSGRIVNLVSMAALAPLANVSAYLVSKLTLIRLSELMALETASHGVRVFAVSPGTVRTDMIAQLTETPEAERWIPWARQQLEAVETPLEDAVSLVLAIASGTADHLSGRVLNVRENLEQVIAHATDVERDNLYRLRIQGLQGVQSSVLDAKQ